jgi:hypothetical protein
MLKSNIIRIRCLLYPLVFLCDTLLSTNVRARVAQWVRQLDYLTTHTSLSPIRCGFAPGFVYCKIGCTRLTAASIKVYQLLAHGRWFSPGTPASSTTKTGCHDIAEILLKVALNTKNQKSNHHLPTSTFLVISGNLSLIFDRSIRCKIVK